jgi:hypothetical protein
MYECIKLDEQEVTIKMQAKIKQTKMNNKKSNKQSLVQTNKMIPSGVAILSWGDVVWRRRRLVVVPPVRGFVCWERFLDLIIKL